MISNLGIHFKSPKNVFKSTVCAFGLKQLALFIVISTLHTCILLQVSYVKKFKIFA